MNDHAAGASPVDRTVRPGAEAHKLTDRQIADLAFAVLREHNDNRLWRALTYDSGPYDIGSMYLTNAACEVPNGNA